MHMHAHVGPTASSVVPKCSHTPSAHMDKHLFCLYTVEYLLCVRYQLAFLSVLSYFLKHICVFPDLLIVSLAVHPSEPAV